MTKMARQASMAVAALTFAAVSFSGATAQRAASGAEAKSAGPAFGERTSSDGDAGAHAVETDASAAGAGAAAPDGVERRLDIIAALPPVEMHARGLDLLRVGEGHLALVVFEEAFRRGYAPAAVSVGELYDPDVWATVTSPFNAPNPERAADWYGRAADAGVPGASERRRAMEALAASAPARPID